MSLSIQIRRGPGLVVLALLVSHAVHAPSTPGESAVEAPPVLAADVEQLQEVLIENRIETARPRPGFSLYARDAGLALSEWLAGWLSGVLPRLSGLNGPLIEGILRLLLLLTSALLLASLIRLALLRWRRRRLAPAPVAIRELGAASAEATLEPAWYWEAQLRQRLEADDVTAATLALWWWLASGLMGDRARPSWTSRELIARAGRRDLAAGVGRLDRMIYGSERPSAEAVGRLWRELREAVG